MVVGMRWRVRVDRVELAGGWGGGGMVGMGLLQSGYFTASCLLQAFLTQLCSSAAAP